MDIICIAGATPGPVLVTLSHGDQIRQLSMEVARHPAGGWRARHLGGLWGLRCHSVPTAVLLEGAEAFLGEGLAAAAA